MAIPSTGLVEGERRLMRGTVGYTPDEVAQMLRISKNAVYDMIARGEIAAVKAGRLLRIPPAPFHEKFGDAIPE